jgi:hypothetical protein
MFRSPAAEQSLKILLDTGAPPETCPERRAVIDTRPPAVDQDPLALAVEVADY